MSFKKVFLTLFLLISCLAFSQNNTSHGLVVNYSMNLNFNAINEFNAVLKTASNFSSFEYTNVNNKDSQLETEKGENINFKINDVEKHYLYSNFISNETVEIVKDLEGQNYQIAEKMEKIDWLLSAESKMIDKFICFKATCTFKGRNYTAWFTTEIPTQIGPLKMHGLPGLIIELEDDTKEIYIVAIKITKSNNHSGIPSIYYPKINRKDYKEKILTNLNNITTNIATKLDRNFKIKTNLVKFKSIEVD